MNTKILHLVLDQRNFYLVSLSVLITCLLDSVWIIYGEVTPLSLLGVKGLSTIKINLPSQYNLILVPFALAPNNFQQ